MSNMDVIKELQFEIEGKLFSLTVGGLLKVCSFLAIPSSETDGKARKFLVRHIQKKVKEIGDVEEIGAATLTSLQQHVAEVSREEAHQEEAVQSLTIKQNWKRWRKPSRLSYACWEMN